MKWRGRPVPSAAFDLLATAALVAGVAAIYAQASGHQFLENWDDGGYVVNNAAAHGLSAENLRAAFSETFVGNYAPVHVLSYMLDYQAFGLWAGGYALENAALHALNSVLFYWLLLLLVRRRLPAFLAAGLFAFHPVQVESVAWISQRKNVLSMSFFLASLLLFTAYRNGRRPALSYAGALAAFVLALLTKSVAVVLPAVLLLLELAAPVRRRWTRVLVDLSPFLLAASVAGALAVASQRPESSTGRLPYLGGSPAASFFTMSTVVVRYLGLLLFPWHVSAAYAPPVRPSVDATVIASFLVLGVVAAAVVLLVRRRPALGVWAGIFVAGLLPVMQIVPLVTLMNDRYLYYPLLGAAPLFVLLVLPPSEGRLARSGRVAAGVLGVALVALCWISWNRVAVWRDDVSLWADTVHKVPDSAPAWFSFASALEDAGLEAPAALAYVRTLVLDPDDGLARSNLGPVRLWGVREGLATRAVTTGDSVEDLVALGASQLLLGEIGAAAETCGRAASLAPSRVAWLCSGHAQLALGRGADARTSYERAAALGDLDAVLAYQQARAEARAGNREGALERFDLALRLGYKDFGGIARDPWLAGLRPLPRFRELYRHYLLHRREKTPPPQLPEGDDSR